MLSRSLLNRKDTTETETRTGRKWRRKGGIKKKQQVEEVLVWERGDRKREEGEEGREERKKEGR
jgi:hypothetical protein